MHALILPAIVACVILVAIVAPLAVVLSRLDRSIQEIGEEEPFVRPIRFRLGTREGPVVGVIGLEPGCGASTIAYNLATLIAVEGRARGDGGTVRPLPICLLSEGAVSTRLGLSSATLSDYLRRHPGDLGEDFEASATSLGAWLYGMCLPSQRLGRGQLSRMIATLRRRHDVVVVECGAEDRFLAAALADEADLLIVCVGPQTEGTPAELAMAASGLLLGRENKTVLVINKATSASRHDLLPEFVYRVDLPADHDVQRLDAAGRPWVLWPESAAAEQLRELARRVLPRLFSEELSGAA